MTHTTEPALSTAQASARIPVPGTFNFRDLGGHLTPDGPVATGRLFRSDGLAHLTPDSHRMIDALGIRTVIDLRETKESASAPDALGAPVRPAGPALDHIRLPLFGDRYYPLEADHPERLQLPDHSLPTIYAAVVENCGERIADTIRLLADASAPVLFHCSAGKDRTGIVSAFVLTLLGVDRADVLDDYQATERYLGAEFLEAISRNFAQAGIVANLSHTATQAPREYMADLLARVDAEHGSVESYLTGHGLAPAEIHRLREVCLTHG